VEEFLPPPVEPGKEKREGGLKSALLRRSHRERNIAKPSPLALGLHWVLDRDRMLWIGKRKALFFNRKILWL